MKRRMNSMAGSSVFPDFLVIFDRLDFLVVFKGEPDDSVVDGENPGIRNGNSVGVSANVGDRAFRSVERFYRVYHPIFRNEFPDSVPETEIVPGKTQFAGKGKFFSSAVRSFSMKIPRNTFERAMTGNRIAIYNNGGKDKNHMLPKAWEVISSHLEKAYRIFRIRTDRAVSPRTGAAHDFYILESSPWVNIIPLTEREEVVLIRQYRHGIRSVTIEIPGGLVEDGDTPEQSAIRELLEETGYVPGIVESLGNVHPNPAFLDNRCYTFLAKNVYPAGEQKLDDREDIEVFLRPVSDIPDMIRKGEITHSLVIAAFYRFFMDGLNGSKASR